MIKFVIKRNGTKEAFSPTKVNKWGEWASKTLGNRVDWPSVILQTVSTMPETVTSQDLQMGLVKTCVDFNTWSYNRMAGRLYAVYLHKHIHGDTIPTVKEKHEQLIKVGFMRKLRYSDAEYAQIEKIINHKLDFKSSYFGLHYIREKYHLKNRLTGAEYETQQFVYMRMAMTLAEDRPTHRRMHDLERWYYHFSRKKLSAPTPNFNNLGTKHKGYASCCVYTTDDTWPSLGAGDAIAYDMTCMSAGIGAFINSRSIGDPVRGGSIKHRGKLWYYRALVGALEANTQGSRGGRATVFFNAFDPEGKVISRLRHPMSPEDQKILQLDYNFTSSKFFANKANQKEDIFVFNSYTAPDLFQAFYSADVELFEELYAKYEADPTFKKVYVNARSLLLEVLKQGYETGKPFLSWSDEMNRHTPHKDTIYSSNLCVAGDTLLLTDQGHLVIETLKDKTVNVWNGEEWSEVTVRKTGENRKLITIKTSSGQFITCTEQHKFYVFDGEGNLMETQAQHLNFADLLPVCKAKGGSFILESVFVTDILDNKEYGDTYCLTEPKRHMAVFNGILTGQCAEIALPSKGYKSKKDLYSEVEIGNTTFRTSNDDIVTLPNAYRVETEQKGNHSVYRLEVGDAFKDSVDFEEGFTVTEIIEQDQQPEIALCSLAGIILANIKDDEEYAEVMYYALLMIDVCIHSADYPFPHLALTAKSRISAGVGIVGLAHWMAKNKIKYTDAQANQVFHDLAERHMYIAIEQSLKLGQELGNAPWMHRTKWPQGWLPLDTYNKNVDAIVAPTYKYDWEDLRARVIANKGIRNSSLVCQPPGESSSKAAETTNSDYPVREIVMNKTDGGTVIEWAAPDGDKLGEWYEICWEIPSKVMIEENAIFQKFTDQARSFDLYRDLAGDQVVASSEMLRDYFYMTKLGTKSRYYQNVRTSEGTDLNATETIVTFNTDGKNCDSGVCTL